MQRPPGVPEAFDVRTVVYLRRGANPPDLSEEESTALHQAHLAHLAELSRRGITRPWSPAGSASTSHAGRSRPAGWPSRNRTPRWGAGQVRGPLEADFVRFTHGSRTPKPARTVCKSHEVGGGGPGQRPASTCATMILLIIATG